MFRGKKETTMYEKCIQSVTIGKDSLNWLIQRKSLSPLPLSLSLLLLYSFPFVHSPLGPQLCPFAYFVSPLWRLEL